jgi:hypothetical protein
MEQTTSRYGAAPTHDEVLESLGVVRDDRAVAVADAIEANELADAIAGAREVADDGLDIAHFTRDVINELRDRQMAALRSGNHAHGRQLTMAIGELARADFRLDPSSPVPLEVALALAILGSPAPAMAHQPGSNGQAPSVAAAEAKRRPGPTAPETPLSAEERFMKELYNRCRMVNQKAAAWLNGSCEVVTIGEDELAMGFYRKIHMDKVATEVRTLVEQQAEGILGRPVQLKVSLLDRESATERKPKGGHLAAAARAMGATPVEKGT